MTRAHITRRDKAGHRETLLKLRANARHARVRKPDSLKVAVYNLILVLH